jgi:enamine deaminase RidA (YjgF/YER057c/UK114 family)
MAILRKETNRRLSQAVKAGSTIYLAGQLAYKNQGAPVAAQTMEILDRIDGFLKDFGVDKRALVSATVWLEDINDYDAINEVWDAWVPEGHAPARACIQAKLAMTGFKIEVAAVAHLDQ